MYHGTEANSPGGTFSVSVMVNGKPLPMYKRLDGALYVPGESGEAYTLQIRNKTTNRIEVINSVDGKHTLKDEPANPVNCRGLILPAPTGAGMDISTITGWRVDDSTTRKFLFGSPAYSVAVRSGGSMSNVGVIGFAVWTERPSLREPYNPYVAHYGGGGLESMRKSAPVAMSSPGPSLGTGIGASQADRVRRTSFERSSGGSDILAIMYEEMSVLVSMGITGAPDPDPFPGNVNSYTGYEKY